MFVKVYDPHTGKLLFTYDAPRRIIHIVSRHRGIDAEVDLSQYGGAIADQCGGRDESLLDALCRLPSNLAVRPAPFDQTKAWQLVHLDTCTTHSAGNDLLALITEARAEQVG